MGGKIDNNKKKLLTFLFNLFRLMWSTLERKYKHAFKKLKI